MNKKIIISTTIYCAISLLGGILYAFGFPSKFGFSCAMAPLLGFFFFNFALYKNESKNSMHWIYAVFFSMGFYLLGFYWIPETLKEFGGIIFPYNQILGLIFSLVIIPQIYIFTYIQRKIKEPILLALLFILLEEFTPQQFPAHLGHGFIKLLPYLPLRLAPFFGAPIYSFFCALSALTLIKHFKIKKIPLFEYSFIAILIILNFTLPKISSNQINEKLNVRIVQPNIGNFLKITSENGNYNSLNQVYRNYIEFSTRPSSTPIDLIIWPETAYPSLISSELYLKNKDLKIPEIFRNIITNTNAEMLIGGYDFIPKKYNSKTNVIEDEINYNAAFHFNKNLKLVNTYKKIKLIPFGEGLPFGPLNNYLKKYITNISYFGEGTDFVLFKTNRGTPFITVICYEILFSSFIKDFLNKTESNPQFLINLTNDSWYGNTAELEQHLLLASWRTIEFNIPIIRATNTGITTIINNEGIEQSRLNYSEQKNLDFLLNIPKRNQTFYERFGIFGTILFILFFYVMALSFKKMKRP